MNIRRALILLGLVAAALLGISQAKNLDDLVVALSHARWYLLVLVLPAQGLSYFASAKYYQVMFRHYESEIEFRRLFEASLAVNFVQSAVPVGGLSGATFLSSVLREVPAGTVTLVHLLKYVFTYVAFLGVLVIGFFFLYFGGGIEKISVRLAILIQLALIALGFLTLYILVGRKGRAERLTERGRLVFNRSMNWLHLPWRLAQEQVSNFVDEFYRGGSHLRREPRRWRGPLLYSMLFLVAEILTLYIVTIALGYWLNPGAVIAAYTLANIASLISPLIGGVGVFEATMIATFAAMGVPLGIAFSMTITYRLLQFLLFLPPGLYYYRKLIRKA